MKASKRAAAILIAITMLAGLMPRAIFMPTQVYAAGSTVNYLAADINGTLQPQSVVVDGIIPIGNQTINSDGVYKVASGTGSVSIAAGVSATLVLDGITRTAATSPIDIKNGASATIILVDGTVNTLSCSGIKVGREDVQAGISVPGSASPAKLTIHGQASSTGKLIAENGDYSACIGGMPNGDAGEITIDGGEIVAVTRRVTTGTAATSNGAGIGGGGGSTSVGGAGGNVTIWGNANVRAGSTGNGAGIGGGSTNNTAGGANGTVKISGNAIVEAIASGNGAGIGGGASSASVGGAGGTISIYGNADVTATSFGNGAGIGGGASTNGAAGASGVISIYGNADVMATSSSNGAGIGGGASSGGVGGTGGTISIYDNAEVEAIASGNGAGIGGGASSASAGGAGGTISIYGNADVTATADKNGAGIGGGASSDNLVSAIGGSGGTIKIFDTAKVDTTSTGSAGIGGGSVTGVPAVPGASGDITFSGNPIVVAKTESTLSGAKDIGAGVRREDNVAGVVGNIVITSGNIRAFNNKASTVTNGATGGGQELCMKEITVLAPDLPVSYTINPGEGSTEYIYTAISNSASKVYVWVPAGAADNVTISTVATGSKKYITSDHTEVVISALAESGNSSGKISGMKWFRVPISDLANYDGFSFDGKYGVVESGSGAVVDKDYGIDTELILEQSHSYSIGVNNNAKYWIKVDFTDFAGQISSIYECVIVDNFYQPIEVRVKDVDMSSGSSKVIQDYILLSVVGGGVYGIPYDLDGTTVLANPSLGFDTLQYNHNPMKNVTYWNVTLPTPFNASTKTLTLNGDVGSRLGVIDGNTESTVTEKYYTASYDRNDHWCKVTANFVDVVGVPLTVGGVISEEIWVPLDSVGGYTQALNFKANGGVYSPKKDVTSEARGWYIADGPHSVIGKIGLPMTDANDYYGQDYFELFNPLFDFDSVTDSNPRQGEWANKQLYIVYAQPTVRIVENHYMLDTVNPVPAPGLEYDTAYDQASTIIESTTEQYEKQAPTSNSNIVCVGYEILNNDGSVRSPFRRYELPLEAEPDMSQMGKVWVELDKTVDFDFYAVKPIINFYYEAAVAGIPKSEVAYLETRWRGEISGVFVSAKNVVRTATRLNREITRTNDGSELGSIGDNFLAEANPNRWFFDTTQIDNLPLQTVKPTVAGETVEIIFYYGFSTNGLYMDKIQYVTEKFKLADGSAIGSEPDKIRSSFVNTEYNQVAPGINGYVAVGSYRGDFTGSESTSAPSISFTRAASPANEIVTFVYKEEAKLNIKRQARTAGSATVIELENRQIVNYNGKLEVIIDPGYEGWVLDRVELKDKDGISTVVSAPWEVILDKDNEQTLTFYYKELYTYTNIVINGRRESVGGSKLYSLTIRLEQDEMAEDYNVNMSFLPALAPAWVLEAGQADKLQGIVIDAEGGTIEINLVYVKGFEDVTIYTKLYGSDINVIAPITMLNCESGKPFGQLSPSISGYQLVSAVDGSNVYPFTETIPSVNVSNRTLTFYYKVAVGDQLVIFKDADTSKEIGQELIALPVNVSTAIIPPSIPNYTTTDSTKDITWGGNETLEPIIFEYTRAKSSLTLQAYNTLTGEAIKDTGNNEIELVVNSLRVLENYDYSTNIQYLKALVPTGYMLAASGSTLYYIEDGANEVKVWFTPRQTGMIPVEVRIAKDGEVYNKDNPSTYVLLQTFSEPAAPNEVITFSKERIPEMRALGYVYSDDNSILTSTEGSEDIITIVYTEDRYKTRIYNNVDTTTVIEDKTIKGQEKVLYPPIIDGYVVSGYSINDETTIIPIVSGFRGYVVTAATDITFYYDTYVNIRIIGEDADGNELYSFVKRVMKTLIAEPVATIVDLPKVGPTWVLDEGEATKLTLIPNDNKIVRLSYKSGMSTVTLKAMLDDVAGTNAVPGYVEVVVPVEVGVSRELAAPVIPGYNSPEGITITPGETGNVVTFYYKKLTGNVTVIAKEGSVIIGQYATTVALNADTSIESGGLEPKAAGVIPALADYSLTTGHTSSASTYDGITDVVVVYNYEKQTNTMKLIAKNTATGEVIKDGLADVALEITGVRVLEYYDYSDDIDDLTNLLPSEHVYSLASTGTTNKYVTKGSNEVVVWYIPASNDKVTVEVRTYTINPAVYELYQNYSIPAAVGETVTVDALQRPTLPTYYEYMSTNSIVTAVGGGTIVLMYKDNRKTVGVKTDVDGVVTIASEMRVAVGSTVKVYPPHVQGYTATSYTVDGGTPGTIDTDFDGVDVTVSSVEVEVVFVYETHKIIPVTGNLTVIVTTAFDNKALPGAIVKVRLNGGSETSDITDAQGKVVLTAFGDYEIEVTSGSYNKGIATAKLTSEDAIQTVKIALGKNIAVGGGSGDGGKTDEDDNKSDENTHFTVSERIKDVFETKDHIAYIQGYPDGTIVPNGSITRAEVSTIFWRLIKSSNKNIQVEGPFSDVGDEQWYAQAVNYLASLGILSGYEDGTFKPDKKITRAEFAAIVARFDDLELGVASPFSDVKDDDWAQKYITSSYLKGWISGYPGDVFLPENNITRAEAIKITNCMLGRGIKKEDVPSEAYSAYKDLDETHWAFAEIVEATLEHDYSRAKDGYETHK